MSVSFYSLKANADNSGWNVVQKSFPQDCGLWTRLSITVQVVSERYEDKKVAEIAAAKMAELNKISFVPENTSVLTVAPFAGCYLPVELTPDEGVIGRGTNSPSLQSAIEEAQERALSKSLPFIAPNFLMLLSP